MPSQVWIDAANQTEKKPILLMAVESVSAINKSISGSDWGMLNESLNISVSNGIVTATTQALSQSYAAGRVPIIPLVDGYIGFFQFSNLSFSFGQTSIAHFLSLPPGGSLTVRIDYTINEVLYSTAYTWSNTTGTALYTVVFDGVQIPLAVPFLLHAGDRLVIELISSTNSIVSFYIGGGQSTGGDASKPLTVATTQQLNFATLQTQSIDLGSIPEQPSIFGAEDTVPVSCTLTYGAFGRNDALNIWDDLGSVADGTALAPYRYYRFTAQFTTTSMLTAELRSLNISGGDSQFKYISTHEDTPVKGAMPYLSASIGTLTSKLELMKLGSTGEISPKMFYLRDTFEMIRDGYLRNKAVGLRLGFPGLALADYEPIFTGLWYDYSLDHYKAELTVKTRTVLSLFQKVQLPREIAVDSTRDDTTCPVIEWIEQNIISVMLDVIDLMGLKDRYIDRPAFLALVTGARAGSDWNVSRRLDKDNKETAVKLLEELSVLSGVFFLPQPDGRVIPTLYDPAAPITVEIDSDTATFSSVEGGQAELYTRQQICYGLRHEGDLETGVDRGAWSGAVDYARNDSVTLNSVTWFCILSHQSSGGNQPGVGNSYRAFWTTEWEPDTAYVAGDVRMSSGPLYTCRAPHVSSASTAPGAGIDWRSKWVCAPAKNGGGAEDFYNAYVLINQAAEVNWGLNADVPFGDPSYQINPGYQKQWLDKWNATPYARQQLAIRMDNWFANPKMKLKASELPPRFFRVQLGAMVGVTGLQLPAQGEEWDTPCMMKKFMVMSRAPDAGKCKIAFDLLEV